MRVFVILFLTIFFTLGCKEKINSDFLCGEHYIHAEGSLKEIVADIYPYNENAVFGKPEMSFLLLRNGNSYEKETESGKKIIISIDKEKIEFTRWTKKYECKLIDKKKVFSTEWDRDLSLNFAKAHLFDAFTQPLKSKNSFCQLSQNKKEHLLKVLEKADISIDENSKKEELFLFDRYIFEGIVKIPAENISSGDFFTCAQKKKYLFNTKCLKFVKRKTETSNKELAVPFSAVFAKSRYAEIMPTESYFYFTSINKKEPDANLSKFFCESLVPEININEKVSESTVLK